MTHPPENSPLTVQETLDAQAAGRDAALHGLPPGTNPHRRSDLVDDTPARVLHLQLMWIRGYQQARGLIEASRPEPAAEQRTPGD